MHCYIKRTQEITSTTNSRQRGLCTCSTAGPLRAPGRPAVFGRSWAGSCDALPALLIVRDRMVLEENGVAILGGLDDDVRVDARVGEHLER